YCICGEAALPRTCTVPETRPPEGDVMTATPPADEAGAVLGEGVGVGSVAAGRSSTNSGGVDGSAGKPVRLSTACVPAGTDSCTAGAGDGAGAPAGRAAQSLAQGPGRPGPTLSLGKAGAGA